MASSTPHIAPAELPTLEMGRTGLGAQSDDSDEKESTTSASFDEKNANVTDESRGRFEGEYDPAVVGHPWRVKGPAVLAVLFFSRMFPSSMPRFLPSAVLMPYVTSYHQLSGPRVIRTFFLTVGSNFLASSIAPLKVTLKKELGINNAQYANLDTADSLINSILPIISGIAIDYYGPFAGALYSSVAVFIGALLTSIAASRDSYGLFLAGQIIFGFGSTSVETTQNKLYSFYCLGGGILGFVYGLDIGIGRVWNLMGKLTAVPIYQGLNSYAWPFWIGTIMCGFTLALVISLWLYTFTFPASSRVPTGRQLALKKAAAAAARGEVVDTSFLASWKQERTYFAKSLLAIPACFWMVAISQLLQAGAVGTYTSNLADTVRVTRNKTQEAAGYTSAIGQVIPIVLTPCLGAFFDRFGHRIHWIGFTASLWIIVWCLLAFTTVHALCPTILGSFALAFNALPFIASIPLLVPNQANLGTAFGIWKSLNNCGSTIMGVASGAIQDRAVADENQYDKVFAFIIIIKGLDVIYGCFYWLVDKRLLGGILTANDKEHRRMEAEIPVEKRLSGLRSPIKLVTVGALATVICAIVVAWVLFWVYSV
ncbi:hypothetical protein JCM11251_005601 [Rhodosporidiobolus azoricus]